MADRPRRGDQRRSAGRRDPGRAARRRSCRGRRRARAPPIARARAPASGSQPAEATTRTSPPASSTKTTAQSPAAASSSADAVSRPSRSGSAAASTIRRTIASSASAGEMTYSPGADRGQQRLRGPRVGEVALGAELLEDAERLVEMPLGDRAGAGLGDQPSEREMAERRLIALAEQIEQRRALREVVIGVGGAAVLARAARRAAGGTRPRWPARLCGSSASAADASRCSASGEAVRRGQRLGGDERRLQRVERRRAGLQNLVGARDRLVERAAPQREPRAEHAHRPLVPLAGLAAVGAVRVAGAAEKLAGACRSGRESGESAPACRTRRRSFRETGSGCARRARGAARPRRGRDRRAARRSVRAWRARPPGRGPEPCASCSDTLRSASASACS